MVRRVTTSMQLTGYTRRYDSLLLLTQCLIHSFRVISCLGIDILFAFTKTPCATTSMQLTGYTRRYDSLLLLTQAVSNTCIQGYFLPWHRHFVRLYKNTLRDDFNKCDYQGAMPYVVALLESLFFRSRYWDWTQDVGQSTPYVYSFNFLTEEPDVIHYRFSQLTRFRYGHQLRWYWCLWHIYSPEGRGWHFKVF